MVGLPGRQGDGTGDAGQLVGAAVDRRIAADALRREGEAGRLDELDLVGAGHQIGERIAAAGVGRRGRQDLRAGAVQQFHGHALDAGATVEAGVLKPVFVGVQEDDVADRAELRRGDRAKILLDAADGGRGGDVASAGGIHRPGDADVDRGIGPAEGQRLGGVIGEAVDRLGGDQIAAGVEHLLDRGEPEVRRIAGEDRLVGRVDRIDQLRRVGRGHVVCENVGLDRIRPGYPGIEKGEIKTRQPVNVGVADDDGAARQE